MRNVRDTTCSRCGKSVPAAARFCMECGSDLTSGALGFADEKTQVDRHVSDRALLETLRHVTLGEYEVVTEVGRGGMATVFLAHDIALDRKVAIKVITPDLLRVGENVAERFQREARTAAALSHPHIIPIYAVKKSERLLFFIMKFVEGRTLESVLREEKQLPIPMVQTIVNQVGSALDYAHRNGVIHRDIKPGNIMLDEGGWAVVTDFGIAKVTESDGLTITGATIGTPTYMSPEQCAGAKLTGATDQYALGVVTFEMLTGKLPFEGESAMTVMYKHTHEPPPVIFDVWPDCPRPLGLAVMRMLAKVPGDRFPSMEAAMDAIGMSDKFDGEMRTRMVSLAKSGGNRALLERFKTPQSAVPRRGAFKTRPTPSATRAPDDIDTAEAAVGPPTPAPAGKRGAKLLWALLAAVVVGGGAGVVAVMLRDDTAQQPVEPPTSATVAPPAAPTVAEFSVTPEFAELVQGQTVTLEAVAADSAGNRLGDVEVTFQSRDASIATVSSNGLVTAVASGTAQIVARSGGHSVTIGVAVSARPQVAAPVPTPRRPPAPVAVASVSVAPGDASIVVGDDVRLQASTLDARGRALSGRTITWTSSNSSVATVSGGVVTGRAEGTVSIRATSEGESRSVTVTVTPAPVGSVVVSPTAVSLTVGESAPVSAQGRDARGNPLDRAVEWRTNNSAVATVSSSGVIRGVGAGTTTVQATVEGRTANVGVTVAAAVPVAPVREDPAVARQAIERIIQAYASAIQARDIGEIRRLYPSMSSQQEQGYRAFFREVSELVVTAQVAELNVADGSADASIAMVYEFRIDRAQRQSFSIDASLRRQGSSWQFVSMRDER